MSILSNTDKLFLLREPVNGRLGIHRLLAMLCTNSLNIDWNGIDEVSVVTLNVRRTICKIIHVDATGIDSTTRILNKGRINVMFDDGVMPEAITRKDLEQLLDNGSFYDILNNEDIIQHSRTDNLQSNVPG